MLNQKLDYSLNLEKPQQQFKCTRGVLVVCSGSAKTCQLFRLCSERLEKYDRIVTLISIRHDKSKVRFMRCLCKKCLQCLIY